MSSCVFFFGGYLASQTDMNLWVGSAKAQRQDVEFAAYPWPSSATDSGGSAGTTSFRKSGQFDAAVKAIQASPADRIFVVGHSSGCAIANAVDKALKDKSRIELVALDGYLPDGKQLERASTQVWSAEHDGHVSLHHDTLKKLAGARFKVYKAGAGTTKLALHFAVVNTAANDDIKKIRQGYTNCRANLAWL